MRPFFRKTDATADDTTQPPTPGARVLVVDDSPTETRIFAKVLTQAGYRVETATNGEEAIAVARRSHPDLILMDVVMPVLNGFQATRMLQRDAETADIPVIMVTTKDQQTDRTWGLRQGAVDYLIKPVDAATLLDRVRVALEG
ncbi:response regulator [Marichromatium gracile]|uniref:Twitching motility two-component system response regulator PilH n=1 Tax=Marichromatium gracile TaxID=1048 RepID=A0A4R4AKU4_MARGR|nr:MULTISPECIES: response regulator [Marichromatium]MCF1182556.1 response regulator [Marichromatium gracile]TCW40042.1 twitching motility two-component system response regulator PilH [Marichromatium gracile]